MSGNKFPGATFPLLKMIARQWFLGADFAYGGLVSAANCFDAPYVLSRSLRFSIVYFRLGLEHFDRQTQQLVYDGVFRAKAYVGR